MSIFIKLHINHHYSADNGCCPSGTISILLDANPLNDVKNARKIAGVFVDGRWLGRRTIDAMPADLSRHNSAAKGDYDWKKTISK
ncbi:hypothetical protein CLV42_104563 [Chitinophaga ginsengisoli]|uniref:Uncharacterized protein n=2 Tax=Chitinophaga ginsengisoli TaxID=363837 RepID=A0A2P8GE89_9BACT|nr:hypothetical protein CLV42_104563 [Chitinophaga ginsengisoli]